MRNESIIKCCRTSVTERNGRWPLDTVSIQEVQLGLMLGMSLKKYFIHQMAFL
jgi:hypothetical protein